MPAATLRAVEVPPRATPPLRPEWERSAREVVGAIGTMDERGRVGVTEPTAYVGKTVTVVGRFGGANLFEDLPPESRLRPDWVLRDGPYSIWICGRPPKGQGFALDTRSRAESRWRLEVQGRVETRKRYVCLRALRVLLVGRGDPEEVRP